MAVQPEEEFGWEQRRTPPSGFAQQTTFCADLSGRKGIIRTVQKLLEMLLLDLTRPQTPISFVKLPLDSVIEGIVYGRIM